MLHFNFLFGQFLLSGNVDTSVIIAGSWPETYGLWDNFRYVSWWAAPESIKRNPVTPGTSSTFYYGDVHTTIDWVMEGGPDLTYGTCADLIRSLGWGVQGLGVLWSNHPFYATISDGIDQKIEVTVEKIPHEMVSIQRGGEKPSTRLDAALFTTDILLENSIRNVIQQSSNECSSRGLNNRIAAHFSIDFRNCESDNCIYISVYPDGQAAHVGFTYNDILESLQALLLHYTTTDHWCSMTGKLIRYDVQSRTEFTVLRLSIEHWYEEPTNEIASVNVSSTGNATASVSKN